MGRSGRNWRRGRRPAGAPPSWNAVLRHPRTSRASRLIPPTCWARHRSESEEAAKDVRWQREAPAWQGRRLRLLPPDPHLDYAAAPGKRWVPPAPATAQPGLPVLPHASSLPGRRAGCGHADVLQVPRACVRSLAPGGSSAGCGIPFPRAVAWVEGLAASSSPDAAAQAGCLTEPVLTPSGRGTRPHFPPPRTQAEPKAGCEGSEAHV